MARKSNALLAVFLAAALVMCAGCSARPESVVDLDGARPEIFFLKRTASAPAPVSDSPNVPASLPKNTFAGNEEELGAALDEICRAYSAMGMSVAAFAGDEIVFQHSFGYSNKTAGTPADGDTIYRIASVSKLVTTALALMLRQEGTLDLDYDLRGFYPQMNNPYFPDEPITARELMTHTSSLCDGTGYSAAIEQSPLPSLARVFEIGGVYTASRPGTSYVYSNFGLGLVSGVIERASGKRIYDYAKEALFEPLGMDAAYSVSLINNRSAIANIYRDGVLQVEPSKWGNMSEAYGNIPIGDMYLLGHGDLYITARDLAKLGSIFAGDGTYMGRQYLTAESLALLNTEQYAEPLADPPVHRGLGSMQVSKVLGGRLLVGHQGNAYGMLSCLFYDPASHCGIAFITNGVSSGKDGEGLYNVNADVIREMWKYFS